MIFIYLFRYIFGYVRVAFYGEFCERILNLSARNRATLWDIKKKDSQSIEANISLKNFKNIRKIRARSEIRVKILEKVGFPFIIKKHSKRMGFAIGIILFFTLLNFLSGFIWRIEVVGNEKISKEVILTACNELNIFEGTKKSKINTARAKEELLIKLKGLAWASFNIEGSCLTVNVSEIKNNDIQSDTPSNLLAKFDGVIKHINVKSGNCLVKVGDAVIKDDILVSGVQEFEESGVIKKVRSKAEILAVTKRTFTVKIEKTQQKNILSEKKTTKRVLSFFGLKIPLFLGETKPPFIEKSTKNEVKLFEKTLPISITKKTYSPVKEIEIKLSNEDAKTLGEKTIDNMIENGEFNKLNLIDTSFKESEKWVLLSKTYECEENIVYEVNIEENILQ